MNTLSTAAEKAKSRVAELENRVQAGDKLAPWLLLVVAAIAIGAGAARDLFARVTTHPNMTRLRADSQAGDQFVSWILVILAVIAIGLLVVAAVNGWFQGRIGQLGN